MPTPCSATQTKDGSTTWRVGRSRAARTNHTEALTSTGALKLTSHLKTSSTCSLEAASPPVSVEILKELNDCLDLSVDLVSRYSQFDDVVMFLASCFVYSDCTHVHEREDELQPSDRLQTREDRGKGRCMRLLFSLFFFLFFFLIFNACIL